VTHPPSPDGLAVVPSLMRRFLLAALPLLLTVPPASCQPNEGPRLVVVLTVDQLIPDYFERFRDQLTGGLARIVREGVYYSHGLQDHAVTETAPGHSTILSGRSPASTGIIANNLGVPDPASPLLHSSGPGASPAKFRGTTLADWMLAGDPGLRVLSISRKDRGAILPIGRMVAPVFWYSSAAGIFTTSTWYATALPDWIRAWNARGGVTALAGHFWELLLPESEYPEPDFTPWERNGAGNTFPYQLPVDSARLFAGIQSVPWMDSLTLDLALDGVRAMQMGQRGRPDLLAVSLSTTDAVGHTWGPESREIRDQILRLDHWLGWFLDSLETTVGRGRLLVALTSDHGVQPYPEGVTASGRPAGRTSLGPLIRELDSVLVARHGLEIDLSTDSGLLMGDVAAMRARGVDPDSLSAVLSERVGRLPGVRRVFTPTTLAAAAPDDHEAALWRRLIPPDLGWLVAAALAPNFMWSTNVAMTTHGTTNPSDLIVPIAFLGAGVGPRAVDRPVRTIDIGTTLAALLGIRPLEPVEGVALPEVVGGRR